ncbi:hypothetical protein B566_EDAN013523 [Ephemera danica]|nr:hypothetical protein B566_EDAN013523 [Ephemera danica]
MSKIRESYNRYRREVPAPIPLLINPADVKKEFDKHRVAVPKQLQNDFGDTEGTSSCDPKPSSSHSEEGSAKNGYSSAKKEKKTKAKKGNKEKLKRSGSNESLNSSSTDASNKKKKIKKPRLDSSLSSSSERRSFGESTPAQQSSIEEGREMLTWIIHPVSIEDFFSATWEKRPLHIAREHLKYYEALPNTEILDTMLRKNKMLFGKNVDITSYTNGERKTMNPEGRASPMEVWDFYKKGCSVRILNPQTFNVKIWTLNSMLQEYFGCFVGANIYLTPPGTQGFAPHYDDIEAFVLQLEGKKHWRLYSPRCEEEQLPRYSSDNLSEEDIGDPIMDVVLEAGDLLYFPRGTIHQANALKDSHSLHITISCYQKNTWADLIEMVLPRAIEIATAEVPELRQGLPRDFLQYLGVAHCEKKATDPRRNEFMNKLKRMMEKVFSKAPVDATADQFGKKFLNDALPPVLTKNEFRRSGLENSARMVQGKLRNVKSLDLSTEVRLIRANILRMVAEDREEEDDEDEEDVNVTVYHCADNSREYHAEQLPSFQLTAEEVDAVEGLVHSYPNYTVIGNLSLDSDKERLDLANKLWKKGLLLTSKPLEAGD